MDNGERKPRLSIDITLEQRQKLSNHLEYGMQRAIFSFIINELIAMFEVHGSAKVIGALITRSIELKELLKLKLED